MHVCVHLIALSQSGAGSLVALHPVGELYFIYPLWGWVCVCHSELLLANAVFLLFAAMYFCLGFYFTPPPSLFLLVAVVFLHLFSFFYTVHLFCFFFPFSSSILNPWHQSPILLLPSPIYLTPSTEQMALRSSHKMLSSVFGFHGAFFFLLSHSLQECLHASLCLSW